MQVVLAARNEEKLKSVLASVEDVGGEGVIVVADVSKVLRSIYLCPLFNCGRLSRRVEDERNTGHASSLMSEHDECRKGIYYRYTSIVIIVYNSSGVNFPVHDRRNEAIFPAGFHPSLWSLSR